MSDSSEQNKARDKEIAENEADRQIIGDIRVSTWAIAAAVVAGLVVLAWVLMNSK